MKYLDLILSNKNAVFGLPLLLVILCAGIFGPLVTPSDPFEMNLSNQVLPPFWLEGGSYSFPLGTDQFGRDLFSRIIYGCRASLAVGIIAVLISAVIGVMIGLMSGFFRGIIDEILMTIIDVQMAFPFFLLALVISFLLGPSIQNTIVALGIAGWVTFARVTRGEVMTVKEREYVLAANSVGCSTFRILTKHILPQLLTPIIILSTLQIGRVIIVESGLSFLGMGIQPPIPTWGNMMSEGREYMLNAWWYSTFPGLAVTLAVLAFNITGDWLRDLFDPKSKLRN